MNRRLLVIDDDAATGRLFVAIFRGEGVNVEVARDGREGLARASAYKPQVVLLDLRLPGLSGLEVLERLRLEHPDVVVIMMTAHGDVKSAVRATQLGAFDYLTKPIEPDELLLAVARGFESHALRAEVENLRRQVGSQSRLSADMGPSEVIASVVEQVQTVAASSFSVLILGETGTGKELVAQAIHRQSDRRGAPFVALDCGAIPDMLLESELFGHEKGAFTGAEKHRAGQFRLAEGGTILLDEIGNMPLGLQAKLLRVLESREVHALGAATARPFDVRIVAATNHDLASRAATGKFRADLYFRLAQFTIALPPLRERQGDIAHLARRFLQEASIELRRPMREIAPDALATLQRHPWPGNVRELRNVVRQAVLESRDAVLRRGPLQRLLAPTGRAADPRLSVGNGKSLKEAATEAAREAERQLISETLRATRGNKSQAARTLRTDYKTLHLKMKSLGIRARDFSP